MERSVSSADAELCNDAFRRNINSLQGDEPEISATTFLDENPGTVQRGASGYRADVAAVRANLMTKTALRLKYKTTADSHRAMLQRQAKGAVIHDEFREFLSFLDHVGPRPSLRHTLDRLNHENPAYGPGLVRWADKRQQANNRSTTIILTSSREGESRPLTEWAKKQGVPPDTMRKRHGKGWTDDEVIYGKRGEVEPTQPWPDEAADEWRRDYNTEMLHSRYQKAPTPHEYCYLRRVREMKALLAAIERLGTALEELELSIIDIDVHGACTEFPAGGRLRRVARLAPDRYKLQRAVEDLEAQRTALRKRLEIADRHCGRIRSKGLLDLNRRDVLAFKDFLNANPGEKDHALALDGLKWNEPSPRFFY